MTGICTSLLLVDGYALPVIVRCYTEGRPHRHHKRAADAGGGDTPCRRLVQDLGHRRPPPWT
jgi:hypothetical protein